MGVESWGGKGVRKSYVAKQEPDGNRLLAGHVWSLCDGKCVSLFHENAHLGTFGVTGVLKKAKEGAGLLMVNVRDASNA